MRQHVGLDAAAQLELALQPLAFDDQLLPVLDVLRHLVEGAGQRAELVARAHRHARGEVALRDALHAVGERRQVARHAARQRHDAEQGERDDAQAEREARTEAFLISWSDCAMGRAMPKVMSEGASRVTTPSRLLTHAGTAQRR